MLLSVPVADEFVGSRMREFEGLKTVPRLSTTGACASSLSKARSGQEKQDGCYPHQESLERHIANTMTQQAQPDDLDNVNGEHACQAGIETGLTAVP